VLLLPQLPELFERVGRLEQTGPPETVAGARGRSWSETVLPILARTLRVKPELIGPDMDLKEEFNADSLTVLTVVTEIESQFAIAIPDEDVPKLRTLAAVVSYLEKNYPDSSWTNEPYTRFGNGDGSLLPRRLGKGGLLDRLAVRPEPHISNPAIRHRRLSYPDCRNHR